MKKMEIVACMTMAGLLGIGAYTLLNKNTKPKADKLINNFLDKANTMSNNMMNSNYSD